MRFSSDWLAPNAGFARPLHAWVVGLLALAICHTSLIGQGYFGGDLIVSDYQMGRVFTVDPMGTVTTLVPPGSLSGPSGLMATRDGRLVVSDFNASMILTIDRAGSLAPVANVQAIRMAPDQNGDILATELVLGNLLRIDAQGAVTLVRGGFGRPFGITVDPSDGSYLLTEDLSGQLWRISRDGSTQTLLSTGLGLAQSVALFANGDYCVMSGNPDVLYRVPRGGGAPSVFVSAPTLGNPCGMVSDGTGGFYVSESAASLPGNRLLHIDPAGAVVVMVANAGWPAGANLETVCQVATLTGPDVGITGAGGVLPLSIEIPQDAGLPFLLLASASVFPGLSGGPADPRALALNYDLLFQQSLAGGIPPLMQGFSGTLDPSGRMNPVLDLTPLAPGLLSGVRLHFQGLSFSPQASSGIQRATNLLTLQFL